MQLHQSLETMPSNIPIALTIGAFDGIHLGHEHLIRQVQAAAARLRGASAVLTFDPHPARVLHPEHRRLYLTTLPERIALLKALAVDHTILLHFDRDLARVSAEEFMARICRAMALRELWVGPDARLGAGGRGTADVLRRIGEQLGYSVHDVDKLTIGSETVSSTTIRHLLTAGAVDDAARLLGHPFSLGGIVVHGDHRGSTIGFPTANVDVSSEQLLPADGVYACRVYITADPAAHDAVTNVGVRPTFGLLRRTVEAHLVDWSGDLYGTTIRITFLHRLRGEQKFDGIQALVAQIRADVAAARDFLAHDRPDGQEEASWLRALEAKGVGMAEQQSNEAKGGGQADETMRSGHEESLAAAEELAQKVERVEAAEGHPVPSQKDADETAATGI